MLKTKIIASSITNLTDARYFAAWGVEAMGFDLNVNSPSFVSPAQVHAFKDWVSVPIIIGQFDGMQSKEEVDELIISLELDAVQLGPFAPLTWNFNLPVYREVILSEKLKLNAADHFIVKSEGNHTELDLKTLKELCDVQSCFLDFVLSPEEHTNLLASLNISGFVLRGGEEEKVGFKSFDEVDEIMEELEID